MKSLLQRFKITSVFKDRKIIPFLAAVVSIGLVMGLYSGIFNNYLHEVLGIGKTGRGFLELPRELPGLLLVLIIALFYRFSEYRIMQFSLLFSVLGLAGLFLFGNMKSLAILMIVSWSLGEHMLMPVRQSISVHHAIPGKEGLAMGSVRGFHNAGQALGYYLGPLLLVIFSALGISTSAFSKYRMIFIVGAGLMLLAFFMTSALKDDKAQTPRKRLYFHKKFTKYYFLEIFYGARKQVFITFAPFVLIMQYGASAELISLLYGIWSLANIFVGPLIGRLLDKFGYRKMLILDAVILIILCLLYGFSYRLFSFKTAFVITCILFVIDSMAFAIGMARDMYAKTKSADKEEFTATLSTGLSVNHLVSILIAIGGGYLWEAFGMEVLFSTAAVIGLGAMIFSMSLKKPQLSK